MRVTSLPEAALVVYLPTFEPTISTSDSLARMLLELDVPLVCWQSVPVARGKEEGQHGGQRVVRAHSASTEPSQVLESGSRTACRLLARAQIEEREETDSGT